VLALFLGWIVEVRHFEVGSENDGNCDYNSTHLCESCVMRSLTSTLIFRASQDPKNDTLFKGEQKLRVKRVGQLFFVFAILEI